MKYKIGDIVTINDVNAIKDELFRKAFEPKTCEEQGFKWWNRKKKEIKKRVKFKIIEL